MLGSDFPPTRIDERTVLRPGALLVWYVFPGEPYEIGAFFHRRGTFQGHYVNLIRPPTFEGERWRIDDRFLDVWVPAGGVPRLLDEDELDDAVRGGTMDAAEAEETRRIGIDFYERARTGRWLPGPVRRWPPDLVPALRLRRDQPGTFYAARLAGRVIAYGLYLMGLVSATSIGFAGLTDAFVTEGVAQTWWARTILVEAVLLAPLAIGGYLPATRWPRPPLSDERSLFVATVASGLAVIAINRQASWADALLPVYLTLGAFSTIFALCRAWYDRQVPIFALAGIVVTVLAVWLLL